MPSCDMHKKIESQIESHENWIGKIESEQQSIANMLADIRVDTAITRNKQETFERIYERHVEEAEKPGGHRDILASTTAIARKNAETLARLERDLKWIIFSAGIVGGLVGAIGKFGIDLVLHLIGKVVL